MEHAEYKTKLKRKRALRKRKKARGTADRPRLAVFRSLKHFYCQLIDDSNHKTLASLSSLSEGVNVKDGANKTDVAVAVGEAFGAKTKDMGVERVRFDVGPYKFHGRVKAFAESFQKSGIKF